MESCFQEGACSVCLLLHISSFSGLFPMCCVLLSCSSVHGILQARIWTGLSCPPPGDLPNPRLPHCGWILYCLSHQGRKPQYSKIYLIFHFLKIFLKWAIFKVFTEFITKLLLFSVLVFWPQGMWDLSSLTKDGAHTPCIRRWSISYWTAGEVPPRYILNKWKMQIQNSI